MNLSEASRSSRSGVEREELLFAIGVAAWLAAMMLRWPIALSFGDEVGYLGQAKLFLAGRIHPAADSPGVWNATPNGPVAQYPLFVSVFLAPLFAISPSAIFATGVLAAIALAWTGSRILKSWGHSPCWGLIFLAHPTVVILARTVMSDLVLSAFALGAWWSLRNRRIAPAILLLAATMLTRATGIVIAGAIVAGEVLEAKRYARDGSGDAIRAVKIGASALALGGILVLASNVVATGTILFGYSYHKDLHPFRLSYFSRSAPAYARALLLNPPLLLAGLIPLWRRRLLAPLFVIAGLGTMMSFYLFVDWAPGWFETLVLAERLILPVVTFLLVGYAGLLATLAARINLTRIATALLVIAPGLIAFEVGSHHRRWQEPMRQAREASVRLEKQVGANELGLTYGSSKAGLMFSGKTSWIVKDGSRPPVLLCARSGNSYRAPEAVDPNEDNCDTPGYHPVTQLPGYVLMLRDGVPTP